MGENSQMGDRQEGKMSEDAHDWEKNWEILILRRLETSVGRDVEKNKPVCTVDGNENIIVPLKICVEFFSRYWNKHYWSNISTFR